jgi:hypothetical protein
MYQLSQTQSLGLLCGIPLQWPVVVKLGIRRLESCLTRGGFQHEGPGIRDHAKVTVSTDKSTIEMSACVIQTPYIRYTHFKISTNHISTRMRTLYVVLGMGEDTAYVDLPPYSVSRACKRKLLPEERPGMHDALQNPRPG